MATRSRSSVRLRERQNRPTEENKKKHLATEATTTLEQIFTDLEEFTSRYTFPYDAGNNLLLGSANWGRYDTLVRYWGREYLDGHLPMEGKNIMAVLMCSVAFQQALFLSTDENFQALLEVIYPMTSTLCFFATAKGVAWREIYNDNRMRFLPYLEMAGEVIPMLREPFEASPLQAPPETYNTHLTYLDARGVPQKARWEDRRWGFDEVVAVGDMEDGRENRYLPVDFTGSQRPQGWPRCWRYPSNPSHLARKCENDPRSFFPCYLCGATVLGACRCSIPVPRVEIVYHGRSRGRAIRSLRRIQKDQLIGEYIGRFIPLGTQSRFAGRAEEAYAMTFDGQPPPDGSNAPGIATLVSYHYGNWSRFMNAPSRNQRAQWAATGNVRFTSEVIAEQLRICVFANEEIEFGAELVVSYGEEYG